MPTVTPVRSTAYLRMRSGPYLDHSFECESLKGPLASYDMKASAVRKDRRRWLEGAQKAHVSGCGMSFWGFVSQRLRVGLTCVAPRAFRGVKPMWRTFWA